MNLRRIVDAILGVYVALLVVPVSALAGWDAGAAEIPVTVFIGIGVVTAAVVTGVAQTVDTLVDRLCSLSVVAVMVFLPLLFLPYLILVVDPLSEAGIVAIIGLSAVVPGNIALLIGVLIRNRRLHETSTEIVAVTVGNSGDTNQRALQIAAIIIVGFSLIPVGVATFLMDGISFTTLLTSFGVLSTVFLLFVDTSRELAVTDVGFRVNQSFTRWDDLAGYRFTDDKIVLVREQWYLPDRRFDREEISDEAALSDALADYLPRLNEADERMDETIETDC